MGISHVVKVECENNKQCSIVRITQGMDSTCTSANSTSGTKKPESHGDGGFVPKTRIVTNA